MKKLSLLIGGLLFSGLIMAQAGDVKGTITLEGQTNIGGVVIGKKLAPSVRFRYFATEKLALRGTFGLSNSTSTKDFYSSEVDNAGQKGTYMTKNNIWNLAIGAEYHVEGTDKISPYFAIDLVYGSGKVTTDGDNANSTSYMANYTYDAENPTKRFGAAFMGGLDYNFSPAFYLGGEIGIQICSTSRGPGKATLVNGGVTTNNKTNLIKTGTATDLIAAIRLGFRF